MKTLHYKIIVLCVILLVSCYSTKNAIEKGNPYNEEIQWPTDYTLSKADFYIHNKIQINASAETIWNILIDAKSWPEWYVGMKYVTLTKSSSGYLENNAEMLFSTMKQDFNGKIKEFIPFERLAWETTHPNLNAYHAWLIIPNDTGCLVVTDESQHGKLARLQKKFLPYKLKNYHDIWLKELKKKAEIQESTNF